MIIQSLITGVTEKRDIQIQAPISHLLITKSGAAAIANEQMTLTLKADSYSKTIIPLTKIMRPAVISQFGMGYQKVQVTADGVETAFLITLADEGAIRLVNNNYLTLDLANLVSGSTYAVYGIESALLTNVYNEFNTQTITGGESQTKEFVPSMDGKCIAVSNNSSLSQIRLSYSNGREVTYTPEELNAIMRAGNDVAFSADKVIEGDSLNQTVQGGGAELWYIPLELKLPTGGSLRTTKFSITTVGGVDLTLIQIIKRGF